MHGSQLENEMRDATRGEGYMDSLPLPLNLWRDASDAVLIATTTVPELIVVGGGVLAAKWDHGDTAKMECDFQMPWCAAEHNPNGEANPLKLCCLARKRDATDENANLALEANIAWIEPGILSAESVQDITDTPPTIATDSATIQTLTTAARALMAASHSGAASTAGGFGRYVLDLGARLRAEGKTIPPGSACRITFGPHEQVGATDMDLEVLAPELFYRRHVTLAQRKDCYR